MQLYFDPAILLLGIYLKEDIFQHYENTHTQGYSITGLLWQNSGNYLNAST